MTPQELKDARQRLGLTQAELGRVLGFSTVYVMLLERGKKPIQPTTELAVKYLLLTRAK